MQLIHPNEQNKQQKPPTTTVQALTPPSGNCDGSKAGGPVVGAFSVSVGAVSSGWFSMAGSVIAWSSTLLATSCIVDCFSLSSIEDNEVEEATVSCGIFAVVFERKERRWIARVARVEVHWLSVGSLPCRL